MQPYHKANASQVDSFSPHSDGTKGQPQRTWDGNCQGKNANIGYESTRFVGSGSYTVFDLGKHPGTLTDITCFRRPGSEGLGPLLWYNLAWSSHDEPLFTIPADVGAPQEQDFTFSGVVGRFLLIYGANVGQKRRSNEQWEVEQPRCLWGSSRSI